MEGLLIVFRYGGFIIFVNKCYNSEDLVRVKTYADRAIQTTCITCRQPAERSAKTPAAQEKTGPFAWATYEMSNFNSYSPYDLAKTPPGQ